MNREKRAVYKVREEKYNGEELQKVVLKIDKKEGRELK